MQGANADQFGLNVLTCHACQSQSFEHDVLRQQPAGQRAGAAVGHLSFADPAIEKTYGHLQRLGTCVSARP